MSHYLQRRVEALYALIEENREEARSVGNDYARLFATFFSRQISFLKSKNIHITPKGRVIEENAKRVNVLYCRHISYSRMTLKVVSDNTRERIRKELASDSHADAAAILREISDLISEEVTVGYDDRTLYKFLYTELSKDIIEPNEHTAELKSLLFRKSSR